MSTLADTLYALGQWLIEEGRAADAVHVYRTMLMSAPQDERSWLGIGQSHERLGHDEPALALYELGEKTVPTSFRCPLARARLLRRMNKDVAAESAFERAEERAVDHEGSLSTAIAFERRAA